LERALAVEPMKRLGRDHDIRRVVRERKRFCCSFDGRGRRDVLPERLTHLKDRLDADQRARIGSQKLRELARPCADVDHARAADADPIDETLYELLRVRWATALVRRDARTKSRGSSRMNLHASTLAHPGMSVSHSRYH
jgi:hypothetical protein